MKAMNRLGQLKSFATKATEAILTLFLIATVTFFMLRALPGGPFDSERALSPEVRRALESKYGLDDSLPVQYGRYMFRLASGDWGESVQHSARPVVDIIAEAWPVSIELGLMTLLIAFAIGVPLGLHGAVRSGSLWDRLVMLGAAGSLALPTFMVGPLLVMVFSFGVPLRLFDGFLPPALWDSPAHMILPVLTLALKPTAVIARVMRASALDVVRADYVRTARAKGLTEAMIVTRHILKNALIPVFAVSGPMIAGILSGSFVVETIFAIPGLGRHFVHAITSRDYALAMALTMVFAFLLVVVNLAIDAVYLLLDPRLREEA
jgi:oligopeptide transport system permease protein